MGRCLFIVVSLILLFTRGARADALRDALDASLASGDDKVMTAVMRDHPSSVDQAEFTAWLKEKIDSGQAPDHLAQTLALQMAHNKDVPGLLTYLNYYRAVLMVDSAICPPDAMAGSLFEGSIFLFGVVTRNANITTDDKRAAVDRAIALETTTSPLRKVDPMLCQSGMRATYAKDLNQPELNPPPTPTPLVPATGLYRDIPVWQQKRNNASVHLRGILLQLMNVPTGP